MKRSAYRNYEYTVNDDGSCDVDDLGHFKSVSDAHNAIDNEYKKMNAK